MKICFRCTASKNQFRISPSRSLRRAILPKVKPLGFRRVADMRNSDSRSQSGSANQIVRSSRASLESHAASAGTLGQWRPLDRWERLQPDSLRAIQGNALASVADFGRRRRMRGGEATTFDVGCSQPGCADSTDEGLPSVERRKSSPTAPQTSAEDDPGIRPKGIDLGCSIGDPRGCDDPVESAGTAGPRLVSDGNGRAFRSTSSSTRSLGFVPRRRGFTVACHGECQRCPDLVADRRFGVRFGFGMFPSLETKGTIPNHQVRAGLFVREYSPAIEREQRKCARCNRN